MAQTEIIKLHKGILGTIKSHLIWYVPLALLSGIAIPMIILQLQWPVLVIFCVSISPFMVSPFYGRVSLVIDQNKGTITEMKHYILFSMKKRTFQADKVTKVKIRRQERLSSNNSSSSYSIVYPITLMGIRNSEFVLSNNHSFSRKTTKRISSALNVPFVNNVFPKVNMQKLDKLGLKSFSNSSQNTEEDKELGFSFVDNWRKSVIVSSEELELPLIDRWKRDGIEHGKTALIRPEKVKLSEELNGLKLSWEQQNPAKKYVLIGLSMLTLLTAGLFYIGQMIMASILACLVIYVFFFSSDVHGDASISMTQTGIASKMGLKRWSKEVHYNSINEFIISDDGIHLVGDERIISAFWSQDQKINQYLLEVIPYYFYIMGRRYN